MHIYNWYHSNVTGIHYVHELGYNIHGTFPLLFSPLVDSLFAPLSTYLETLLAVTGSVHLVPRLLVN